MDLKKKFGTFLKIIKKYGIFGIFYSFMLGLHLLYRILLRKKLLSMGIKSVIVELENKKTMLLDTTDLGLSYDILLNERKLREDYVSEYLMKELEKNQGVFFDLGANLGYYTILLSDYFKEIICIEPVESSTKFLKNSIIMNNLSDKVRVLNVAVAPIDGKLYFEDNERKNLVQVSEQEKGKEINAYTIETICKKNKVHLLNFLKMDLEGYEYDIIVKGKESFKKFAPERIFVEIHFDILGRDKSEEILKVLEKEGYIVEMAFNEVPEMFYWLKEPFRGLYGWYAEKFLLRRKIGMIYNNAKIGDILKDNDMMNAKIGAIEFIFSKVK